ncbi:hypothetical protein F0562_032550 [Nyssa sinensis]|uniref:Uncharacterized protein n=1 Tax=Nyssa sinensis TaxID=561372 RepID=A0A5J5AQM6_9ASTE|nr:hypothetical protein F0562_032550 [Nyssa sinensis]
MKSAEHEPCPDTNLNDDERSSSSIQLSAFDSPAQNAGLVPRSSPGSAIAENSPNGKLIIFCLFLTVIVLRGNLGAGKFGTSQQDFEEICERFYYRKRAEPRRVLVEAQTTTTTAESASDNNYATFDINKILVDKGEDEKPDPNKPYSLGPKISDWDEQRAEWLKRNPNFANFIGPNKPRVLLVTGLESAYYLHGYWGFWLIGMRR